MASQRVLLASPTDFDGWRTAARRLFIANVAPQEIEWTVRPDDGEPAHAERNAESSPGSFKVSREFVEAAQTAILHSDPQRFAFLYSMLWRLRDEPSLLKIASDPDVRRLEVMSKAIRRDIHKMRAFVRFRKIDDDEIYVAWFEPSHFILERNAEFFRRRFAGMTWSIFTPYRSAHWDREKLTFDLGADRKDVPAHDDADELWRTYYRNIFNPARLKVKAMQAEMPKKYWHNLPEASLIPELVSGAAQAAKAMIARMPTLPSPHHAVVQSRHWSEPRQVPTGTEPASTLSELREQAMACRRCPLGHEATQTVFGEGPQDAEVVFVGEQPGDQEDIAGAPFVGPAGRLFDGVLKEAGIDRERVYVTNAVKHFKFEPVGKRRIHQRPNAGEVQICKWWLDRELSLVKPRLIVALGATAAQSLLGAPLSITKMRGQIVPGNGVSVFLTIHPSYILRIRDAREAQREQERFLSDLRSVRSLMFDLQG